MFGRFISAAAASADTSGTVEISGLKDSLTLFGIGFGMVFVVLLILMAFIGIMALVLKKGTDAPVKAATPAPAPAAPVATAPVAPAKPAACSVPAGADMKITLGGKTHAVSVSEKLPMFTVTSGGKKYAVDVEELTEEENA